MFSVWGEHFYQQFNQKSKRTLWILVAVWKSLVCCEFSSLHGAASPLILSTWPPQGPLETFLAYRVNGLWNSPPTRTSSWYLCCYRNSSAGTELVKQQSLRKPEWVRCVEGNNLAGIAYDKLEKVNVGKKILWEEVASSNQRWSCSPDKKKIFLMYLLLILIQPKWAATSVFGWY